MLTSDRNTHRDAELALASFPLRALSPAPGCWRIADSAEEVDAVVLTAPVSPRELGIFVDRLSDPLIPVVSLVPDNSLWVDAMANDVQATLDRIRSIRTRLDELPERVRYASEADDILLARMYSRDRNLEPTYDSASRDLVTYPTAGRHEAVAETALRLFEDGYLNRKFFDRIHCCPNCRSGHLSVREECHSCRSANIREAVMVHHFKCGHTEPESKFKSSKGYECPKCGHLLRHIGLDYDKPGTIQQCLECGDVNDKPAVGFKCVDCGIHHDAEQVASHAWYSFGLTARGIQRVLGQIRQPMPTARPSAFQVLLEHVQREELEFKTPYQVVRVLFPDAEEVKRRSVRTWVQTRLLLLDALNSALRPVDLVHEEADAILILMPRTDARGASQAIAHIRERIAAVLKVDLSVNFELVTMKQTAA